MPKNNKKMQTLVVSALLSLLLLTSVDRAHAQEAVKQTLRVALFPYIPDSAKDKHNALLSRIEREFEKDNAQVDLQLRPLNSSEDFYDIDQLKTWLTPSNEAYDVVEVDMVVLDELLKRNLISNWKYKFDTSDWHPAALKASTMNNQTYGIPHWLCGHFIFSHDKSIRKVNSLESLLKFLNNADPNVPNLTADLLGSWNTSSIYLDSWADTYNAATVTNGLGVNLDKGVLSQLKSFANQCRVKEINPCLESIYNDNDTPALLFADGKSDSFFGYSERLNVILSKNSSKDVHFTSAPIGKGKNPVLFVDSLVKRSDCAERCEDAATKFALYLNSPATQEWILMSKDAKEQATPRYLIPATNTAFKRKLVSKDKHYKKIREEVKNASPYPNTGFYGVKSAMRDAIIAELKNP